MLIKINKHANTPRKYSFQINGEGLDINTNPVGWYKMLSPNEGILFRGTTGVCTLLLHNCPDIRRAIGPEYIEAEFLGDVDKFGIESITFYQK